MAAQIAMRIFLDANILFSAAKSTGAVRQLLKMLQATGHVLVVDDYVKIEAGLQRTESAKLALGR